MKCLACSREKELNSSELYPYNGEYDALDTEDPIPSLLTIECQSDEGFRMAIMCHECWHKLCENTQGIDMWISEKCWLTLRPNTLFKDLPNVVEGDSKWSPETYM